MVDIQVGEPDVKPPMINTLSAVDTVAYRVILEMNLTNDFGNNRNFLINDVVEKFGVKVQLQDIL